MSKYEENAIPLRELKEGERFLTKGGLELVYLYDLGNDKHRISEIGGIPWDVPNGNFPSFKYIKDEI